MSLLFAASSVFAQKAVTVQGVVTDATFNEPVIGANVLVKGTTVGTICDMDGKYLIENVPADGTLVFSFIGMRTVEVKVNGNTTVNVVLSECCLMMFNNWKMSLSLVMEQVRPRT